MDNRSEVCDSSPPAAPRSPRNRPACPPPATGASKRRAARRSRCSPGSAPSTTPAWNAATSPGKRSGRPDGAEGKTLVGSATLASGKAAVTVSKTLAVGSHTLAVAYSGDKAFKASTGTVKVKVAKASSKASASLSVK